MTAACWWRSSVEHGGDTGHTSHGDTGKGTPTASEETRHPVSSLLLHGLPSAMMCLSQHWLPPPGRCSQPSPPQPCAPHEAAQQTCWFVALKAWVDRMPAAQLLLFAIAPFILVSEMKMKRFLILRT